MDERININMQNNFIYTHIRKISIYNTIISLVAFIVIVMIYFHIPFHDIFYPSQISYANSAYTVFKSDVEYIEITLNDAHYTGYDCYRKGKVYASYYYSLTNNTCTLILVQNDKAKKLPAILDNYTIKARLIENDKLTKEVIANLAADLEWTEEDLTKITAPITINETKYHQEVYFYLALCLGIITLILISYLLANIIYAIFPFCHPSCLYFKRLTNGKRNIAHVDYEVSSKVLLKSGNMILTESYILSIEALNIEIIPINKIIWAYEHSTWHHFLWFKTKLTYTLNLFCRHNIHFSSPKNTKEDIDTILNYLQDNYPKILFGYTKENHLLARKKAASYRRRRKQKNS